MATLTVGYGQDYSTIGAAIAHSHDGDVIDVQAGIYLNDFSEITTKITLQGVGGMVKMIAFQYPPNDKGILTTDTDVKIDHFEFEGAMGFSGNAAGIRYQGGALTITNSYFHDNQNGLLSNPDPNGTISISNSEFDRNGNGDGATHNIYVGEIASVNITNSYFHDALVGNEIKSRAYSTTITNTRVFDNSSTSSWSIDLPNGGNEVLTNNIIEQGPNGQNSNLISFGVEGSSHPGALTMTNNTIINDLTTHNANVLLSSGSQPAILVGTQIYGFTDGTLSQGANISSTGTSVLSSRPALDTSHPWSAPAASLTGAYNFTGGAGDDTLQGGGGADAINGGDGHNYLRGNDGADYIVGGSGFDDINGNKGNDSADGGAGADWVVGGQGNDILLGGDGDDIVYGNMGNDSALGDDGNDTIRGGQGDDIVYGGAGDDWLSGDLGNDTVIGGAGADVFHTFGAAGNDYVTDFRAAEGDRVMIDAGTSYTLAQVGADVVISMSGGAQMTLAGVDMSSLTAGWIFTA